MNANKILREQRQTLDELVQLQYSDFNYSGVIKQYMFMHLNDTLSGIFEKEGKMPEAMVVDSALSVCFPEFINITRSERIPTITTMYGKIQVRFGNVGKYPYYKLSYN